MSVEHIQNSVKDVIAYLKENPKDALSNDPPITAVMESGLRCRATGCPTSAPLGHIEVIS